MTRTATPGRARNDRTTLPTTPLVATAAALAVICGAPTTARGGLLNVRVGPVGGVLSLDSGLRNYRWDTSARPVWGGAARIDAGRFAVSARMWRASTAQALHIPGESLAPDVRLTGTELSLESRVAGAVGLDLLASGAVGALHLGYSPDAVDLDDGFGGTIRVDFAPVTEATVGVGLGLRRAVSAGLDVGLSVDRTWFRLETTHRDGPDIVTGRETFGIWTTQLALTHRITGGS